jgi:hypothetical protein
MLQKNWIGLKELRLKEVELIYELLFLTEKYGESV